MDRRLLELYETELLHVRGMSQEFRVKQRDAADRLGLDELHCADPYVERMIDAFAFLTARVQLQLEHEWPRFTQHLLELLYPGASAPMPSVIVARLAPDFGQPLTGGHVVRRGTEIRAQNGASVRCDFRTAHDVTLWPIELVEASYTTVLPRVSSAEQLGAKGCLRLRLRAQQPFSGLPLDRLPLYLTEDSETALRLYEVLLSSSCALAVRPVLRGAQPDFELAHVASLAAPVVAPLGFEPEQSLFLCDDGEEGHGPPRRLQAYRLLQEYFAAPRRFLFAELRELSRALARVGAAQEIELLVLFRWATSGMALGRSIDGAVTAESFSLFSTPAVNLFRKSTDPILLRPNASELAVVADPSRPLSYEVHTVTGVTGRLARGAGEVPFTPVYGLGRPGAGQFTLERRPFQPPNDRGALPADYRGSDVFLGLVQDGHGGVDRELRHLDVSTWCTNRGQPLALNRKASRFSCQSDTAVASVTCLTDPTRPRPSPPPGTLSWRLIEHLALQHRSLLEEQDGGGAPALRRLLELYALLDTSDHTARRRIEGLTSVRAAQITRPLPGEVISYGRGISVSLVCDELHYDGSGAFLFGAVLDRFLARYATINGFTETSLHTPTRGEVMRWPMRAGRLTLI